MGRIGLDIGTTGVRAVEVVDGRGIRVRRAASVALPDGAVIDGVVRDVDTVAGAIRGLWKRAKFSGRKVSTSVGGHPHLLVRQVEVPYLAGAPAERAAALSRAAALLPTDLAHLEISHHVYAVKEVINPDESRSMVGDALITAVARDVVGPLTSAITAAGLECEAVDSTPYALTRMIAAAGSGPGRVDVVVHMGASAVTVIAVLDGQMRMIHPLPRFAGAEITRHIGDIEGLPPADAERVKIAASEPAGLASVGTVDRIRPFLASFSDMLVHEVRMAVDATGRSLGCPVGGVWLVGGGAGLEGLASRLGAMLDASATAAVLDPSAWVTNPARLLAGAAQPFGIATQDMTIALAAALPKEIR